MTVIEYREVADVEEFETRASVTDDGAKVLSGYAFRYNSWSLDLGGFKERLAPSSADKTLRARNDIKALANHDSSKVLGSTKARTLEIESDSAGARDVITLPDTTYAHDLWTVVDRRDVRGQSFGMSVVADGIESQAHWDLCARHGIDAAQGYLLGRPTPPEAFAERYLRT